MLVSCRLTTLPIRGVALHDGVVRSPHMGKKLYVGNLGYGIGNRELEQLFAAHGSVRSAEVITDRTTKQSKGFGFVEMESDQEARAAIAALNGKEIEGRTVTVNEARPKEGDGGGGKRGGYGGGGRRY
jgi:cold-inducible RNA-binding protein